jgi:hypothetical protein
MIFNAGGRMPSGVELLWTNDAPDEDFTETLTIPFLPEILDYKISYIVFKALPTPNELLVSMISTAIPFGYDMYQRVTYVDSTNETFRDIYIKSGGLAISKATNIHANGSMTTMNDKLIPLYIYGSHKMV